MATSMIFARRLAAELAHRTGAQYVEAFRTSHVLFLLAAQDRHVARFREMDALLGERWQGQMALMEPAHKSP